eukprot:g23742.t1
MPPPWPPPNTDLVSQKPANEMDKADMGYANEKLDAAPDAPKAHETMFSMMLEKFKACEVRDDAGTLVDIKLEEFWIACDLYREMLSKLGSAANMIVSDIQQNLANAKAVYDENPGERSTLSAFLQLPKEHVGIAKLTWLCRGCEFFLVMLNKIFTENSGGNPAVSAYEETLMKYHGWFLQKSLKIALRALPSKDAIVQSDGLVVQGDRTELDTGNDRGRDLPLDKKRELCERDAPVASTEAIEVVHLVFDMMKQTGRWDDRKA